VMLARVKMMGIAMMLATMEVRARIMYCTICTEKDLNS
jgi:hypothetical protein